MAVDIHWVFERRHESGRWVAVFSDARLRDIASTRGLKAAETADMLAARELMRRNHAWFSRLSGQVEGCNDAPVLNPGMPEDAALYTRDYLAGDRAAQEGFYALRPRPFERHGVITLAEIHAGAEPAKAGQSPAMNVSQNAPRSHYLRRLSALFEKIGPRLEEEILFGRVRMVKGSKHPDMDEASNHQRLDALAERDGLLPIEGSTLRWIAAYGH